MKMIVGLGNPGSKYVATRHNIGFILLDAIGDAHGSWREKFNAEEQKVKIAGQDVVLLKPQTFMNKSGISVQAAAKFYKIGPQDILVIHDELDLQPGQLKLKKGGGHAGHNGLRSIGEHMGLDFERLRVGIGHPGDKSRVSGYVLHDFAKADQDWIAFMQDHINTALPHWLNGKPSLFMEAMRDEHAAKAKPKKVAKSKPAALAQSAQKPDDKATPFDALKAMFKK